MRQRELAATAKAFMLDRPEVSLQELTEHLRSMAEQFLTDASDDYWNGYNTLLTIASEMILVPYFLVGAFLLKIATRPLHKAVGVGACIYGLWLLYASGPMHLLLSVVLYAPGLLVFLYARKTHTHDNVLNRQEMVLIGMLLIASVPATWMLVG